MGNDTSTAPHGTVTHFHTTGSWIEGAAVEQAVRVAALPGVLRVSTLPDLHPGRHGPVGCTVASTALHPHLVGTDVGCGMALSILDAKARKLNAERAAERLRRLGDVDEGSLAPALEAAGLPTSLAAGLCSIGGGNHFAEVQRVDEVIDADAARALGIDPELLLLLVHTGSRGHGARLLSSVAHSGRDGLAPCEAEAYMAGHDTLVAWARLNRAMVADRAAALLGAGRATLTDVPHNVVVAVGGEWVHHKGAAMAAAAAARMVPVAGSRGTPSFVVTAADDLSRTDGAISHGAGRKRDRAGMRGRVGGTRSDRERLARNQYGGRVVCDDRDLLREEAPEAYKPIERVVADLVSLGLARAVARTVPLVTYKVALDGGRRG